MPAKSTIKKAATKTPVKKTGAEVGKIRAAAIAKKAAAKAPVKKLEAKKEASPKTAPQPDPSIVIKKYMAQLTRLAESRHRTVIDEVEKAIHDHLEKQGML